MNWNSDGMTGRKTFSAGLTILCDRYWPDAHGGVEQHMLGFSTEMARCGVPVTVVTGNRCGGAALERLGAGLTIKRLTEFDPGRGWRWRELGQVSWWKRAMKHAGDEDWIWTSTPQAALGALRASAGRRVIYNPPACYAAMNDVGRAWPGATSLHCGRLLRWMERLAWKKSGRVIAASANIMEQLERRHGLRDGVMIVPLGARSMAGPIGKSEARVRLGLPAEGRVTGFVGRLDPCKGLDHLLKAYAGRLNIGDDERLLIVGDGPERDRIFGLANRLCLQKRMVWAGNQPDPSDAYAAMDLLVLPSIYEGFGLVIPEAMSAGLPVIGRRSAVGSARPVLTACEELITPGLNGLLIDPHDPGSLADALDDLMGDSALLGRMSEAARSAAGRHTWRRYVKRVGQLLDLEISVPTGEWRLAA